jgi:hypothetical protein
VLGFEKRQRNGRGCRGGEQTKNALENAKSVLVSMLGDQSIELLAKSGSSSWALVLLRLRSGSFKIKSSEATANDGEREER